MIPIHKPFRRPLAALATLTLAMILLGGPVAPARAADGSLVVAALQALERYYVDPVHPVELLNAAVETLRQATHQSAAALPNIPSGDTEAQADAAFMEDFAHAAQAGMISQTQLAYAATQGMLASLRDTHTYFLNPAQLRASQQELLGNPGYTGIGVRIISRADPSGTRWVFVEDVLPGSPAAAAGVQRFDRILQVGTTSLRNATPEQASQAIRGPAGSTVTLTIQHGTQVRTISVDRAAIQTAPVEARVVQPGVAYVRVFEFSRGSASDLAKALGGLAAQAPFRAVILDLRGNPGGLITEAARVGSLFLPSGTVLARINDRQNGPSTLRTAGLAPFAQTPMVVLTDGGSASGAEIVAGAFKDLHRAAIVGDKTAGALGGAINVRLPEGGMSVTVVRIMTPQGQRVEGLGITPDIPVSLTVADMERGEDVQLQAALKAIEAHLHLPKAS